MTCTACTRAAAEPISGLYIAGCTDCAVRQLASSPEHAQARDQRRMLPAYVARLRAVFGDDWEAGHQRVKAFVMGRSKAAA